MSGATVLSATSVIGTEITNPSGEDLGKIEDLVLDLNMGVISYAVVSYGGFLGMGNKWFAIPWSTLAASNSEDKFVLNVPEEKLKEAEGFDKDNWPGMDRNWGQQVHERYGVTPYWER